MAHPTKRRLLVVLACPTVLLLGADLASSPLARAVRTASASVLGPVQRAVAGAPQDEIVALRGEVVRLRAEVQAQRHELSGVAGLRQVLGGAAAEGQRVIAARVVAAEVSPLGGRAVTLDVGARDGITVDSTVVAAEGLVGRVVAVTGWTCDVQVLGSHESVVAVRVGPKGLLGTVAAGGPRTHGVASAARLTLTLAQPGSVRAGDAVTTLGSIGGRPYAPGIVVGTVSSVESPAGGASGSRSAVASGAPSAVASGARSAVASVAPAVDADALDVVAVLVPVARTAARTPATGGAG